MFSSRHLTSGSKERLPLMDPCQKSKTPSFLALLGQGACLIVGILGGICGLSIIFTVVRQHHFGYIQRGQGILQEAEGCMTPGALVAHEDVGALYTKHRASSDPLARGLHKLYGSIFMTQRATADLIVEVGSGSSDLLMWRDYFSRAQIVGFDVGAGAATLNEDRIMELNGANVTNPFAPMPPMHKLSQHGINAHANVLIDNADHDPTMQGRMMEAMYDVLGDGGMYVVENFATKPEAEGGEHHFCKMPFRQPFVFGLHQEDRRVRRHHTSERLRDIFGKKENGIFYAATEPGVTESNAMVMLKKQQSYGSPFSNMPYNYHLVYNILLSSVPIRNLASYRSLHGQTTGVACGSYHGIDVFIASALKGVSNSVLHDFMGAKTGSYLFVEEASFSFCNGAPSSTFWSAGLQSVLAANPDWFYAMTDEDSVLRAKMIVIRKH